MSESTPLQGALLMLEKGAKVFPIRPGEKVPAVKHWQKWAEASNAETVNTYGKSHPFHNWGVYCGASDLTVIDVDVKKGVDGKKTLADLLDIVGDLKSTFSVETPSGGLHLYFKGAHRTSAGALGPGIDTRGKGGYVVAPLSRIGRESYRLLCDTDIMPIPPAFCKLIDETKKELSTLDEENELPNQRNNTLTSIAGTMRSRGLGYEAILAALMAVNSNQLTDPLSEKEVEIIARSVSRYSPSTAEVASDFLATPKILAHLASEIKAKNIPKRDWIMDHRYIGGFISVLIAPGGVGKSNLSLLDALSLASGLPLSGFPVKEKAPVWVYNTEDPKDELDRRILSLSVIHEIKLSSLDNLHVTSGRDRPLILAKNGKNGVVINTKAMDEMVQYIKDNKIRVLIVDPFVRSHEVNENDNMQIDKVVWVFQRIAERSGCAVCLIHHSRKPGTQGSSGGDMNTARGASSLVNAARIAHTLTPMGESEGKRFGISPERTGWFVRLDNAKANLSAPADRADWFEKVSVDLFNGDAVGALKRSELKDISEEMASQEFQDTATDIARELSKHLKAGDSAKVSDVYSMIGGADCSHLFNLSERRAKEKLISFLKSGFCNGDELAFQYEYRPEEYCKHMVNVHPVNEFLE